MKISRWSQLNSCIISDHASYIKWPFFTFSWWRLNRYRKARRDAVLESTEFRNRDESVYFWGPLINLGKRRILKNFLHVLFLHLHTRLNFLEYQYRELWSCKIRMSLPVKLLLEGKRREEDYGKRHSGDKRNIAVSNYGESYCHTNYPRICPIFYFLQYHLTHQELWTKTHTVKESH